MHDDSPRPIFMSDPLTRLINYTLLGPTSWITQGAALTVDFPEPVAPMILLQSIKRQLFVVAVGEDVRNAYNAILALVGRCSVYRHGANSR